MSWRELLKMADDYPGMIGFLFACLCLAAIGAFWSAVLHWPLRDYDIIF